MINFFFENIDAIELSPDIKPWLETIVIAEGKKPGTLNYIFCDDEHLLSINRDFLDHDYFTDVITFDYVKGKIVSGDIFVSLPRISENALLLDNSFDTELLRVTAHGILHLCGYKDKHDEEILEMRNKEEFYLSKF